MTMWNRLVKFFLALLMVSASPGIFSSPARTRYRSNSLPGFQKHPGVTGASLWFGRINDQGLFFKTGTDKDTGEWRLHEGRGYDGW
jgi:hypothetical protein